MASGGRKQEEERVSGLAAWGWGRLRAGLSLGTERSRGEGNYTAELLPGSCG